MLLTIQSIIVNIKRVSESRGRVQLGFEGLDHLQSPMNKCSVLAPLVQYSMQLRM